jgi:hypothetical protein
MIRTRRAALAQSGYRSSLATNAKALRERSCSNKKTERDDDSKKNHLARKHQLINQLRSLMFAFMRTTDSKPDIAPCRKALDTGHLQWA